MIPNRHLWSRVHQSKTDSSGRGRVCCCCFVHGLLAFQSPVHVRRHWNAKSGWCGRDCPDCLQTAVANGGIRVSPAWGQITPALSGCSHRLRRWQYWATRKGERPMECWSGSRRADRFQPCLWRY